MGVNRKKKDFFIIEPSDANINVSSESEESEVAELDNINKNRPPRTHRKPVTKPEDVSNISARKKMGAKPRRRLENLKNLLSMVSEKDEDADMDMDNIMEPSMSVFAELFAEHKKMMIWNDFVNKSEEEQCRFLDNAKFVNANHVSNSNHMEVGNENNNINLNDSWEMTSDKREVHPGFSAAECFDRIETHLKAVLKRRHLPKGMIDMLEDDLVSFFLDWPTAVYVSHVPNNYQRLLLHGLCQYLRLSAHSFDEKGSRQTNVENNEPEFHPPDIKLTSYVERFS